MRLIVSSKDDPASQNILRNLLNYEWSETGEFKGNLVYQREEDYIITVNEHHIYVDEIDKDFEKEFGANIDRVVFISKHASEAGIHSLTVHPIGNYGEAKFGGLENRLVPTTPTHMTSALRLLNEETKKKGLDDEYEVSFEATHHGPYLEKPTYYIEIGSDEGCWTDDRAGKILAETVLRVQEDETRKDEQYEKPVLFCIGGGHYAPRFTDLALEKSVSIGHMVPGWALDSLDKRMVEQAVEKSEADHIYFDRSSTSRKLRDRIKGWVENMGVDVVRSNDLADL